MKIATVSTFQVTAADTSAHPLTSIKTIATSISVWPANGSGTIMLGDATNQFGFAPYDFSQKGDMSPVYDLSTIYFKLTNANDTLNVLYVVAQ